eukprot:COSAG02_NODE_5555_length_4234_cov_4.553809_5_plen_92_part_01
MGAHYPGQRVEAVSPDPIHNVETWELSGARVSAEGATSARFDTVTALGIAVEPIVHGPRDTTGTRPTGWQERCICGAETEGASHEGAAARRS